MKRRVIIITAVLMAAIGVTLLSHFYLAQTRSERAAPYCLMNLQWLDFAKEQLRIKHHFGTNYVASWEELRPYFPDRWTNGKPVCPKDGIYTLGRIGEPPKCSIPSHKLP